MKKILAIALTLILTLSLASVCGVMSFADVGGFDSPGITDTSEDGLWGYFNLTDGTIQVGCYFGNETEIEIPSIIDGYTVTSVDFCPFGGTLSSKPTSVKIPETVSKIVNMFWYSNLVEITVDDNNDYFSATGNALFNKNKTVLKGYCRGNTAYSYEIPSGVEVVAEGVFMDNSHLEMMIIPESLNDLDFCSFADCENLINIYYAGTEEKWQELCSTYSGWGENALETATIHYNYTNSTVNGIDVLAPALDDGTTLNAVAVDGESITANTENTFILSANTIVAYDIYLESNGERVQPTDTMIISLPIPAEVDAATCKVFHIDENGVATDMNATLQDGYMVFETDHLSYYAVVGNAVEEEEEIGNGNADNNNTENNDALVNPVIPNTDAQKSTAVLWCTVVIALFCGFAAVSNKRKACCK